MHSHNTRISLLNLAGFITGLCLTASSLNAQSVCLPAPRLMTTMPMGGQVGTTVDVKITGQNFENVEELSFSNAGITAVPATDANGQSIPNKYTVTIAADCPPGIYEARALTRLGISSCRAFNVSTLPEVTRTKSNTSIEKAMALELNSICNAWMTKQAVDFYSFHAEKDQRIVVDCAAKGIDSKLNAVLIVADSEGNDLKVERRGGAVDFTAPETATYIVKVHGLTFDGGSYHFYRLALQEAEASQTIARLPSTKSVNSFSWPPAGLNDDAIAAEQEPNNSGKTAQKIELPCDISGSFFPAADIDTFEFTAQKGDVWWVEVASERFGLPTDPSVLVQRVTTEGEEEKLTDVAELSDIASPIKISSNGYSYDGPPYNAGSSDIIGKVEIKETGIHRLQILDLFGGTRKDPRNIYRMIIRKASPDFAIVGWALHMNLRNGDRNALSKPFSLRGGATMPIEVVAVRRDGFDGEIQLSMDNLPEGVTATGLSIPKGKTRGIVLLTADQNAPRGLTQASFYGTATINGEQVKRTGQVAQMKWPVTNARSEIPDPRLLADIPIAVCGSEFAPITIAATEDKLWEVPEGSKLTIPLINTRRYDFSGKKMSLKTYGNGFERNPAFDAPLDADTSEAVIDLAKQKTKPGDYTIAFYGSAVAKYGYHPEAVDAAKAAVDEAKKKLATATAAAKTLVESAKTATDDNKAAVEANAKAAAAAQKLAAAAVAAADKQLKAATKAATPKDIVDIVVSKPIRIRVTPATQETSTK